MFFGVFKSRVIHGYQHRSLRLGDGSGGADGVQFRGHTELCPGWGPEHARSEIRRAALFERSLGEIAGRQLAAGGYNLPKMAHHIATDDRNQEYMQSRAFPGSQIIGPHCDALSTACERRLPRVLPEMLRPRRQVRHGSAAHAREGRQPGKYI